MTRKFFLQNETLIVQNKKIKGYTLKEFYKELEIWGVLFKEGKFEKLL
jgi:hypothetical protein